MPGSRLLVVSGKCRRRGEQKDRILGARGPLSERYWLLECRNIMLHLRELLEKSRLHCPILEVVGVLKKNPRHFVSIVLGIEGKNVSIGEWPVEVEVLDEGSTEDPRRGVLFVLKHQPVTQAWPY
jgi:hypothetical protein